MPWCCLAFCWPWRWEQRWPTDGLTYLGRGLGWWAYIAELAGVAVLVVLLPAVVLGTVLPYLMRRLEADPHQPGEMIGRLVMADTLGAMRSQAPYLWALCCCPAWVPGAA
jgi:hypothetical protein